MKIFWQHNSKYALDLNCPKFSSVDEHMSHRNEANPNNTKDSISHPLMARIKKDDQGLEIV